MQCNAMQRNATPQPSQTGLQYEIGANVLIDQWKEYSTSRDACAELSPIENSDKDVAVVRIDSRESIHCKIQFWFLA